MTEIAATLRLRTIRIGLLVRPSDKASVRQFMRLCTCLWGGRFNPIIPVSKRLPKKWQFKPIESSGIDRGRGYLSFFEPDVFIEAEDGLAELVGYGELKKSRFSPEIVKLSEFVQDAGAGRKQFAFGLSMLDVFDALYESEHRFVQRDPEKWVYFTGEDKAAYVEAVFGRFPR